MVWKTVGHSLGSRVNESILPGGASGKMKIYHFVARAKNLNKFSSTKWVYIEARGLLRFQKSAEPIRDRTFYGIQKHVRCT